jgi:hypothetical protein
MPEFDLSNASSPFHDVIRRHNAGLPQLRGWRASFQRHAADLTAFLLEAYPQDARWVSYWRGRRADLQRCFENDVRFQGNRDVFRPWNGRWSGTWHGSTALAQHHIWDETQDSGGSRIQPVTQSITRFVGAAGLAAALTPGAEGRTQVDLGINVWRPGDGITGWVSKGQFGPEELPHVGYSPNPHTLLWITQPTVGSTYWMFFEWVDPPNRYGIHGRSFQLMGQRFDRGGLVGWTVYHRQGPATQPSPARPGPPR